MFYYILTGQCNDDFFTVDRDRKFTYLCGNAPENWHCEFLFDFSTRQKIFVTEHIRFTELIHIDSDITSVTIYFID